MKIQIIKKADKTPIASACNWYIEGLLEPTR